jgi:hypothetical protein
MNMVDVKESDWKLFRKRLPIWQENYMDRLNRSYIELLESDKAPSDKFWELEKRIRRDQRSVGVQARMSRSMMESNILGLLSDGVIGLDDLEGFSDDLTEKMRYLMRGDE